MIPAPNVLRKSKLRGASILNTQQNEEDLEQDGEDRKDGFAYVQQGAAL